MSVVSSTNKPKEPHRTPNLSWSAAVCTKDYQFYGPQYSMRRIGSMIMVALWWRRGYKCTERSKHSSKALAMTVRTTEETLCRYCRVCTSYVQTRLLHRAVGHFSGSPKHSPFYSSAPCGPQEVFPERVGSPGPHFHEFTRVLTHLTDHCANPGYFLREYGAVVLVPSLTAIEPPLPHVSRPGATDLYPVIGLIL